MRNDSWFQGVSFERRHIKKTRFVWTDPKERISEVEIVGGKSEVRKEVVRVCLRDVGAVEVEAGEHDERPHHNEPINPADDTLYTARSIESGGKESLILE